MYNRYIPQSDGTFRRDRVESRRPQQQKPPQKPCPPPQKQEPPCCPEPMPCPPPQKEPPCRKEHSSAGGFLRQLLPQSFDTGDLIVVLLLLLLAGDCEEDRSTALLTLVLYLFM